MKKTRLLAFFAVLALVAGCTDSPTAPAAVEPENELQSWVGPVGNG
jgi:hypothetical protein